MDLSKFEEVPKMSKRILEHYSNQYDEHNFSIRILLPRDIDSENRNLTSRKLGQQLQSELLFGIRKAKLRPNLKEFRYIHDETHFGWVLFDPSLSDVFE